jgi:hypothetical protein
MAVELEAKIMGKIGLGNHYGWFNGSRSCAGIRRAAISKLPRAAQAEGLTISAAWMARLREADVVDGIDGGEVSLTNVWITASYAIQDAIYRSEGDKGFAPPPLAEDWHFWDSDKQAQYERSKQPLEWHKLWPNEPRW